MFNLPRKKIAFFAKWARIAKPFSVEKHYINDKTICYDAKDGVEYYNHIEMAGSYVAGIISYGCDRNRHLKIMRHVTYPNLRYYPNLTHDSVDHNFKGYSIKINDNNAEEKVKKFSFDGILTIDSVVGEITITRSFFPSDTNRSLCEMLRFVNNGQKDVTVAIIINDKKTHTLAMFGHNGQRYCFEVFASTQKLTVKGNQSSEVCISFCGNNLGEIPFLNVKDDLNNRSDFIKSLDDMLIVKTSDKKLDLMARCAKIRASESIFMTKSGLMHSPGGGGYYAALWTNDQCEYVNPFFAYLGYSKGIDQALNCYKLYQKYIDEKKPLITSIIAEGDGIWHGAGDRGDSAMYAYGASRFLLTLGDKKTAQSYIKYIDACLKYSLSQINDDGVIKSNSDELENRFESGKANLCTNCLAYDALISAVYLHMELDNKEKSKYYKNQAEKLRQNIEAYFGKTIEGYDTYMYCKEETALRSWIAMPLVVGIFDRAEATKNALLSAKLKLNEGLVTRSGEKTFWDRSTLYALRGLFNAGYSDEAYELLSTYTSARLLGEHIPYAVEAFPEGNQAQLSAESALYIRVIIEGILGYRPMGFGKFVLNFNLPSKLTKLEISNFYTQGRKISILIKNNIIQIRYDAKTITAKKGEEICL